MSALSDASQNHTPPSQLLARPLFSLLACAGTHNEFNRIVVMLGYLVLFAPAFPAAPFLCYVAFLFEIRTDAYKARP